MEQNYNVIPKIISGKDLDYLSDMFSWNYGALKSSNEAINMVTDAEIKNILQQASNLFDSNLNNVLTVLEGGNNE